ncbi:MAG TPA: DUF4835 family protein [Bacteroidota bacterium]|nr:DUF4835 family protein [Bacteroidota bacterium]
MTLRNRTAAAFLLCAALCPAPAHAQQADVTVLVNYESIPTTNKDLLRDFASDVKAYLGNYNWGGGNPGDKVKCTLNIFIQSVIGDNKYSAQIFVGSQREIYNSTQSTAVVRLFDETWQFTYLKSKPLNHNSYVYDDLTSVLDFYMYLIMGYDFDTYEKLSGTKLFQKASDIANMGRSTGDPGWQPATSGYSRIQLIDELMSTTFQPVRAASWYYHFAGLDSLAINRSQAWQNMVTAISMIAEAKRNADLRNVVIKSFFEAKAKELAGVFTDYPDVSIYSLLENVDPNHTQVYEEAKAKHQ